MAPPVAISKKSEPITLAAGDEVNFTRNLPKYSAADGWLISYNAVGGGSLIQWNCAIASDGQSFNVIVPAANTLNYIAGDYDLTGYVSNAATGERYQFYQNNLMVTPNIQTAQANLDLTTHAQRMLASIEEQLEQCSQNILLDTTVEGTRVLREKRMELLSLRNKYLQERKGEIAAANARSGKPTGRKIKTFLSITPPGNVAATQFGAGNSVFNTQYP